MDADDRWDDDDRRGAWVDVDEHHKRQENERDAEDLLGEVMVAVTGTHFSQRVMDLMKPPQIRAGVLDSVEPIIKEIEHKACQDVCGDPADYL